MIVAALGLTMADLFDDRSVARPPGHQATLFRCSLLIQKAGYVSVSLDARLVLAGSVGIA